MLIPLGSHVKILARHLLKPSITICVLGGPARIEHLQKGLADRTEFQKPETKVRKPRAKDHCCRSKP